VFYEHKNAHNFAAIQDFVKISGRSNKPHLGDR